MCFVDECFRAGVAKGWVQIVHPLIIPTSGGAQKLNCANTEGLFRIIQSIPSPKAGPFKRWLAKVGYERVQEIEDPELASKRTRAMYKAKGYSDDWIEELLRSILRSGVALCDLHSPQVNDPNWRSHFVTSSSGC
jgi:hypothetical protein